MTDRLTILKVIQESAGPSHYLVQFDCDECISIITRKQLLRPSVAVVNGECWVNWNGEEYSAKVLAVGDQAAMKQAEADILNHLHASNPVMRERLLRPQREDGLALKRNARVLRRKNRNSQRRSKHVRLNKSPALSSWR